MLFLSNFVKLIDYKNNTIYYYIRECDILIFPSIDKLLNIVDSKYELVLIAAHRSKEISKTGFLQMPENKYKSKRNIGRALEEVNEQLIDVIKK